MVRCIALICLALIAGLEARAGVSSGPTHNDFSGAEEGQTPFVFRRKGKAGADPVLKDGRLQLLFGRAEQQCSLGFERTAPGAYRRIEARFSIAIEGQNEGFCLALLATGRFDTRGAMWDPQPARKTPAAMLRAPDWAEPNLLDSFAVGFDLRDPKDEDWFNEHGNFYGRPEREVSLHWAGREVANTLCPVAIATGKAIQIVIRVEFVSGGAEVSVNAGGTAVYTRRFIAHMLPFECRAAIGAHGAGEAFLDDLEVTFREPAADAPPPLVLPVFHRAWLRKGHSTETREVDLCPPNVAVSRIILTVTYRGPMQRDFWDRGSAVYAWDDAGVRFEIARLITPFMVFGAHYRYDVDVTWFRPLLFGRRKLAVMAGSAVAHGFLVDATLTYYRGAAVPGVVAVRNLWSGRIHFNKPGSVGKLFTPRDLPVPAGAKQAFVRLVVSGHGVMEFTPLGRTLTVNGKRFQNRLWKEDNYLNPTRRQFGTWKFDRAGWGPGAVVEPWIVDVSGELARGGKLHLEYAPDCFQTDKWAEHWVEAQLVFLR